MLNDSKIQRLVISFRRYIELAKNGGLFQGDLFDNFPDECCTDTSYMLAEFLLTNNIETIVVSGENSKWETHTWLVVKDERIIIPQKQFFNNSEYIKGVWNSYRACADSTPIEITQYEQRDIENGLIIDVKQINLVKFQYMWDMQIPFIIVLKFIKLQILMVLVTNG